MGTSKSFRIKGVGLRRRMDGWMGVLFIVSTLSLGRFGLGGSRREREACWSGPVVGGSAFFFLLFFFSFFGFRFFFSNSLHI